MVELRMTSRTRKTAYVYEVPDVMSGEKIIKLIGCSSGMTHGPNCQLCERCTFHFDEC